MAYTTIITEGGLLPADILDAIASEELPGQRPEDFGLERGRNLSDRIAAAWQAARGHWMLFKTYVEDLREGDPATSVTRQRWVLPLLDLLGYQLTFNGSAYQVEGRSYALSHRAGQHDDAPPVHVEGIRTSLDARPPSGRPRLSPHALLQEYLNSTEHLWGIVTNGERLRLLRDSSRFTRPTYVEFDLRAMFEGEKFSEFALLYRLLHRSRLPHDSTDASTSLLEKQAVETGGRVREKLRDGVETALKTLGNGLLAHPANAELRAKLEAGKLTPLAYYRQLLKLVYRLLFLMVAEERGLIATGTRRLTATDDDPFEITSVQSFDALLSRLVAGPTVSDRLRIYYDHYSVARLRRLAEAPGTGRGPYDDLWQGLQTTFRLLEGSDEQSPRSLGLAPLDGDLFGPEAIADLEGQRLRNAELLGAIRALSLYREKESKSLRRVNYGALDVEELGSVYESLLDYRPMVLGIGNIATQSHVERSEISQRESARPFASAVASAQGDMAPRGGAGNALVSFSLVTGTERKTTGSYYTRPELVQELIKSALVPVIEERLKAATTDHRPPTTVGAASEQSSVVGGRSSAQEEALLAIKVCDPACGSGHFLLAAARRLGRELAKVRSGEEQPTPSDFRRAVRDVIQHCIYGVDLNPLAVDLCKLALWIEGHNAGMPLSFLDHHIKQGNSLIGATRALVAQGIPDDAYKAVTGDDKATASSIKKRNKAERELYLRGMEQRTLFDAPADDGGAALAESLRRLDDMAAGSVAEVRAKAARYRQIQGQAEAERTRFNLWTAAFFQPLTPANAPRIATTATLADYERNPRAVRADTIGAANGLAAEANFFHWELEFPQVFVDNQGGFDVVLGNPPWEMIQLDPREFFIDSAPHISEARNMSVRDQLIKALVVEKPELYTRYQLAKHITDATQKFIHESGSFPLTSFGRINLMSLFSEHFRKTISIYGRCGIIVPIGIVTDSFNQYFFASLMKGGHLAKLIGFENEAFIFLDVHNEFKFCAMTITGSSLAINRTEFMFFCRHFEDISQQERHFTLSIKDLELINPNTNTCPIFRTRHDAELTKKIYNSSPILAKEDTEESPWGYRGLLMFMMNSDSGLFRTKDQLQDEGYEIIGNHFLKGSSCYVPLYEAKMIWQYDHRFASLIGVENAGTRPSRKYEGWYGANANDPNELSLPQYWVSEEEVDKRLSKRLSRNWLLAYREVTNSVVERTAIFSLLPKAGANHKAPLVFFHGDISALLTACFLATSNSFVVDYVTRQKVGGTALSAFILKQLPVLPPSAFSADDIAFIVPRVLELVYTAWDMRPFAEDVWAEAEEPLCAEILRRNAECNAGAPAELFAPRDGFVLPPFRWSDERRALIRAELDARIAKLYGLTRDELRYILDPADVYGPDFPGETFRVLKEKEIKQFGEYRTRRLVLEAWDREGA